jgi:hypothetical protein
MTKTPRPAITKSGSLSTTPRAGALVLLLGGFRTGPVSLNQDELRALRALYGHVVEQPWKKPAPPEPPPDLPGTFSPQEKQDHDRALWAHKVDMEAHSKWKDPSAFHQAGSDRNLARDMEADGLRMVAWIARYLVPGEDPVRALVTLAVDAGWDVDPEDVQWADEDPQEQQPPPVSEG